MPCNLSLCHAFARVWCLSNAGPRWSQVIYRSPLPTEKWFHVQVEKLSTASFCRRRLAVVMVRLKMAQTLREAVTFIEQVQPVKLSIARS